jgi:hypothetical protein
MSTEAELAKRYEVRERGKQKPLFHSDRRLHAEVFSRECALKTADVYFEVWDQRQLGYPVFVVQGNRPGATITVTEAGTTVTIPHATPR